MKTTIGGDRLGSGQKKNISMRNYERSTHDLSYLWRSSMSAGTLVPFMSEVALPGDTWDINLNCEVLTLPTVGPLFGSYKVQLDVFEIPIRLYNAGLHMNRLDIGMDMDNAYLPRLLVNTNNHTNYVQTFEDNEQINPSSLLKYLGFSGLGYITGTANPAKRYINAVPFLAYWDIYKNYYANKQENRGFCIHTASTSAGTISSANLYDDDSLVGDIYNNPTAHTGTALTELHLILSAGALEPDPAQITISINSVTYNLDDVFGGISWDDSTKTLLCTVYDTTISTSSHTWNVPTQTPVPLGGTGAQINMTEFDLNNIDDMREDILQHPYASGVFTIDAASPAPYDLHLSSFGSNENVRFSVQFSQEQLALKTYQSDLFNNWMDTDWIDGVSGINEITKIDTSGGDFTIDTLNLAHKVYVMLNRIAISGGTYDDWLDAVYTHERSKGTMSPVYHGSLIKELAFEEVISNSDAETTQGGDSPLGTLAGRGRLTQKNKGGKMVIRVDEPSYIMGIVSLTPRVDYSQGNKWDVNLETLDDLHKPGLDQIGYQDLVTDAMCWTDTQCASSDGTLTYASAGKQPAWINYMTNVNKCYGNFADQDKEMFMTLNRRYEKDETVGDIEDLTTYIDPTKFNHIFADTNLDAQNFWVQISNNITARRKMSAKVIPNL